MKILTEFNRDLCQSWMEHARVSLVAVYLEIASKKAWKE